MIARIATLLLIAGSLVANAQSPALPVNRTSSVSVDSTGTVIAPQNFWAQGVAGLTDSQIDAIDVKLESRRLFPVFQLPMNAEGAGAFTDFELKSSTDNFASVLYWYDSVEWINTATPDGDPLIFIVRPDMNSRAWLRVGAGVPIFTQLLPGQSNPLTVIVIPSKISGSEEWMFPGNTALRWTFRRKTPGSVELDGQGREVWHPIVPVQWLRERLVP